MAHGGQFQNNHENAPCTTIGTGMCDLAVTEEAGEVPNHPESRQQ